MLDFFKKNNSQKWEGVKYIGRDKFVSPKKIISSLTEISQLNLKEIKVLTYLDYEEDIIIELKLNGKISSFEISSFETYFEEIKKEEISLYSEFSLMVESEGKMFPFTLLEEAIHLRDIRLQDEKITREIKNSIVVSSVKADEDIGSFGNNVFAQLLSA